MFGDGSLIPAGNHFAAMAGLFVIAALGFLAERTRIGALVTGAVVTILLAIVAANLNIIPGDAPAYGFVFSYFVPILIPLFLMKADLRKVFFETGRLTMAFLLAAFATVVGAIVAVGVLDFAGRDAEVAGVFTATYIGGSVNFAALLDITGLRQDANFVSTSVAADNLASALFLGLLAIVPGWRWLANRFPMRDHSKGEIEDEAGGKATAATLAYTITFALVVVALGDFLTAQLGNLLNAMGVADAGDQARNWRYAIITVLAVIPATAFPKTMAKLHGGYELGLGLAFVFFAAIAAGADIPTLIQEAPILMALVIILLTVHAIVLFGLGSLFRFSMPELITASNAAVLGATTAPALAAAKGWKDLVTPGVIVGVFGYALGTIVATGVYQVWSLL
ncbi:DUF819 family protein [Hyphobacterium sp. SN044]|uniref:DUF819 family protein n=1 Tax=Hyphobacterium sp. SN044 TaxID=2912575 RepID=UPI001F2DA905|nr:DUF819 family protein [Hyphobacterium sp. SN044]MCF8879428.1 DUF819 family protein [Hyphobacterium sp. SN044]